MRSHVLCTLIMLTAAVTVHAHAVDDIVWSADVIENRITALQDERVIESQKWITLIATKNKDTCPPTGH